MANEESPISYTYEWGHNPGEPPSKIQDPAVYQTPVGLKAPGEKTIYNQ